MSTAGQRSRCETGTERTEDPGRSEDRGPLHPLPESLQAMQTISRMTEATNRTATTVMKPYTHRGI